MLAPLPRLQLGPLPPLGETARFFPPDSERVTPSDISSSAAVPVHPKASPPTNGRRTHAVVSSSSFIATAPILAQPTLAAPRPAAVLAQAPVAAVALSIAVHPGSAAVAASAVPPAPLSGRSRREVRNKSHSDLYPCEFNRCGMQFSTAEEYVDHRERVHLNNRDLPKKPTKKAEEEAQRSDDEDDSSGRSSDSADEDSDEEDDDGEEEEDEEDEEDGSSKAAPSTQADGGTPPHRDGRRAAPGSPRTEERRARARANYHRTKANRLAALKQAATGGGADSSSSSDSVTDNGSDRSGSSTSHSGSSGDSDSDSSDYSGSARSFDAFGRADRSQSDSTSSDAMSQSSDASSSSSQSSAASASLSHRRPPRRRAPPQPRSPTDRPRTQRAVVAPRSPMPSPAPTLSAAAMRTKLIRNNAYLFKWRFTPSTSHHLLRCLLCQQGPAHELGLLLRCHGKCGIAMHAACMEMAWLPSGAWYCSEQCDQGTGVADGEMDELENIRVMRRWRQWWDRRKRQRQSVSKNPPPQLAASDAAGTAKGRRGRKKGEDDEDAGPAVQSKVRFIVRTVATVSAASLRPAQQSRYAKEFPAPPMPSHGQIRRIFRPISLTAPDIFHSLPASTTSSSATPAAPAFTPTDQQPLPSRATTERRGKAGEAGATAPRARPRSRHLMYSLKQPRLDPSELVDLLPPRHPHSKGPLPVTSTRSLRGAHSSLRSKEFLLSLRVPERDPGRAICCVCEDGDSLEDNPIILCDGECHMAYHMRCVALKAMPRDEEEWCCSELCRKAKAGGAPMDDNAVVRLVQSRRDDYDERAPNVDRGSDGSAQLADLFAQLDAQYFCPCTVWRLWKKGRWRMQRADVDHMLDIVELVGGITEPGWVVERIDGSLQHQLTDQQPSSSPSPVPSLPAWESMENNEPLTDGATAVATPPSVETSGLSSADADALSAHGGWVGLNKQKRTEPVTAEIRSRSKHGLSRSRSWPLCTRDMPPEHFASAHSRSPHQRADDFLELTAVARLAPSEVHAPPRSSSASSAPVIDADLDCPLLSEESRLLAAYSAQVLANNQAKARLLAAFEAHRINPASLPLIGEWQRQEEITLRTYFEYEEKTGVGSEKDRARRQERCHVNYCTCAHCYNAHLRGEDEVDMDDNDVDLTLDDAPDGAEDVNAEPDDPDDDAQQQQQRLSDSPTPAPSSFALPPAPPPLSGPIDPAALLQYVDMSMRRREKELALAKSVGGPELTQLLEAGKSGRTLTRGQMRKHKDGDDEPPAVPESSHHTRRRSAALQASPERSMSPTDSSRRVQEIHQLGLWAWDKGWAMRQDAVEAAEAQRRDMDSLPRGHRRLRIVRSGRSVFDGKPWGGDLLPIVRFRQERSVRRAPSTLGSGALSVSRRQSQQITIDPASETGRVARPPRRPRGAIQVRLLLGGDAVKVLSVDRRAITENAQRMPDVSEATETTMRGMDDTDALDLRGPADEVASTEDVRLQQRRRQRDSRGRRGSRAAERETKLAKDRAKRQQQRERQLAQQLSEYQQHERVVDVAVNVDSAGSAHVSVTVLVDYPWARKAVHERKRVAEVDRLRSSYLIDGPVFSSADATAAVAAPLSAAEEPVKEEGANGERRRRSVRSRRPAAVDGVVDAREQPGAPAGGSTATADPSIGVELSAAFRDLPGVDEHPVDFNGLPIIADPIVEDICFLCGEAGDLLLCDANLGEFRCNRAYHLDCTDLNRVPSRDWSCPSHFCTACRATGKRSRDVHAVHMPFTYCEWCDRSWCKACAEGLVQRQEAVDWTPRQPTAVSRWVCCVECVRYAQREYGKDFTDPARQLAAHAERVKEQLLLRESERREALEAEPTLAENEDDEDGESTVARAKTGRAPSKKRKRGGARLTTPKQRPGERRAAAGKGEENGRHSPTTDDEVAPERSQQQSTKRRGRKRPAERQPSLTRVKLENGDEHPPPPGENGHSPIAPKRGSSTSEEESVASSPSPPLVLQPCVTRSDIASAPAVQKPLDPFAFPTERADDDGWRVSRPVGSLDQKLTFRRNGRAVDTTASPYSVHSNGVSPISLPSPGTPGSLPCLSTSSTLSAVSPSSASPPPSTPLPSPPPPSSLSMLAAPAGAQDMHIHRLVVRGEKRTRAATRVEVDGDAQLAKRLQQELDEQDRMRSNSKRSKTRR